MIAKSPPETLLGFTLQDLIEEVSGGWVSIDQLDDLWLFNYTPKAQYSGHWNPVTLAARGLILRHDGKRIEEVVALPFPKFFNWNEPSPYPAHPFDTPGITVTEKLDGALGISYRHQGQIRWTTRGSFSSAQAQAANTIWEQRYHGHMVPEHLTLLAEILHPTTRVVVPYEADDLVLIGARDRQTGEDIGYAELTALARAVGMPVVRQCPLLPPAELLATADPSRTQEGWVIRWPDGFRLKVKTPEYLRIHRIVTGLSPGRIVEAWVDDIPIEELTTGLPDEPVRSVRAIYDALDAARITFEQDLFSWYDRAPTTGRKDFALWVQANAPRHLWAALFARYSGKPCQVRKTVAKIYLEQR